jgi:hypothetical protein
MRIVRRIARRFAATSDPAAAVTTTIWRVGRAAGVRHDLMDVVVA